MYQVWLHIRERCYNENDKSFANYGGRGIFVCDEWRSSYFNFKAWAINNGYKKGLEIDRIENNGGYCPENCRFVTRDVNANNKRNSRKIEIDGEFRSIRDWSEYSGIKAKTISTRFYTYKWTGKRLISKTRRIR